MIQVGTHVIKQYFSFPFFIPHHLPPASFYAGALFFGIITGLIFSVIHILVMLVLILPILFFINNKAINFICLSFFVGAFLIGYQRYQDNKFALFVYNKKFDIVGTITNIEQLEHKRFRQRVTLVTTKIKSCNSDWQPTRKKIQLYVRGWHMVQVQDIISLENITIKKDTASDFNKYLLKEGVAGTIFLHKQLYTLLHRPTVSLKRSLFNIRRTIFNRLKRKLSRRTFSLVSSLFLGNKTIGKRQLEKTRQQFKAWGALHILARSGLHLVIFIMLWQLLLNFIPIPFTLKQVIIVLICSLYLLLSWSSVSFMRAFLTLLLYKLTIICNAQIHFMHILTLVCIALLLYNPMQLLFLDFQLSFGLTFILAWFNSLSHYKFRIKN